MMKHGLWVGWVVVAAAMSACASAHAKAPSEMPPLAVPSPPAHDAEPVETQSATPEIPLPSEPPRRATPRPAPPAPSRPEPRAESPRGQEGPKPEAEAPHPEDASKPTPAAGTLQTTPTVAEGEVERSIRGLLSRASDDLSRTDYRVLNADARTQYDTAKRFIKQAEEALRSKNLVFARNLAEKAASLAAQLGRR